MKIINKTRQCILADNVKVADSFLSRMVGLLNRESLANREALIITHCQSIHMFFMRFAIDVIFLDKSDRVVGLEKNIKPFCLSRIYFKANNAVEFSSGVIDQSKTELGDQLDIV